MHGDVSTRRFVRVRKWNFPKRIETLTMATVVINTQFSFGFPKLQFVMKHKNANLFEITERSGYQFSTFVMKNKFVRRAQSD